VVPESTFVSLTELRLIITSLQMRQQLEKKVIAFQCSFNGRFQSN